MGLLAADTAGGQSTAASSAAALQALEQQHPPSRQQVEGLRTELLQVRCKGTNVQREGLSTTDVSEWR
jgi:hypothetical protein